MMNLEELFFDLDDFCQRHLPDGHRQLLNGGEGKRWRASRLAVSEILTLLLSFHQSHYLSL